MSEYQYYEFRAIDRPLTEEEIDELGELSSRAEITSTSFTNTYSYGDFRGKPEALMDRYFDAFVYIANWGTRRLMFRIPRRFLDVGVAKDYCTDDDEEQGISLKVGKEHVVLEFHSEDEGGDGWIEGEDWMPSLVSLRDELIRGDYRAFYIGWLAVCSSTYDEEDEDNEDLIEPPVPPGLAKLSGPLKSLAEFLRVDESLIEAASAGSEGEAPSEPSKAELIRWVKKIPAADKEAYLLRLLDGERDTLLRAELARQFREASTPKGKPSTSRTNRRTIAQLFEARKNLAAEKTRKAAEKAAEEKAILDRKKAKERAEYLKGLALREAETWREVAALIETRLPKSYDRAVELLVDLRDIAKNAGRASEAEGRIKELRERHRGKPTLMKRFAKHKLG